MVNSVRVYLSRGHFSGCVLRFVDEFPQNGQSACGGLDTVIVVFRLRRNNFASKSVYVYLRPGKLTTNVITTHFKHGWVPSIPKNIFFKRSPHKIEQGLLNHGCIFHRGRSIFLPTVPGTRFVSMLTELKTCSWQCVLYKFEEKKPSTIG